MVRQGVIFLIASILVILFAKYAHVLVVYIDMAFTYANIKITPVFNQSPLGIVLRKIIVLILMPLIIAGIPALIYQAIKHHAMPYFLETTWIIWFVIVLSNILIH